MSLFLEHSAVFSCFGNIWASGKEKKLVWEHNEKENQDKYETTYSLNNSHSQKGCLASVSKPD